MRLGVPRETRPASAAWRSSPRRSGGSADGVDVVVEPGAGAAGGFADDGVHATRARRSATRGRRTSSRRSRRRPPTRLRACTTGRSLIGFLQPLTDPEGIERLTRGGRRRARARVDSADHARAADGCALVAGDGRRLQGGADRRRPAAALLPDADDRRRDDPAGEGARARRRRRGPAGDRDGAPARRRRLGLRRAAGGAPSRSSRSARRSSTSACAARRPRAATRSELTAEQQAAQQAELQERIPQFDVVITTAAMPGRPAPKLVTAEAVRGMRPGSVIVDLAAETGGNCELTEPGARSSTTA